jgi:hypothetical protein
MADEIDKANDQAQLILDKQIAIVRMDVNPYQNESGICWSCDAPVTDNRRWCSIECCRASERGV